GSDRQRGKVIDAVPLLSEDEDAQTIDQIGREKLTELRHLANSLKHALAKLRLRRHAAHHRGEELRGAIGLLRRATDRYYKHESQRAQHSAARSAGVAKLVGAAKLAGAEDRCTLRHVGGYVP
ncbi:MAG: hypothetical protein QOJ51_5873, partial [Acidobacteriaceae bacterium]|nr:hypothetical protein [Acidobacteriaceae bacterium]